MTPLATQIEAELRAGEHSFNIHPHYDGYVGEMVLFTLKSFDLEFMVTGYLRFCQENKHVDPKECITIEPELNIQQIAIYNQYGELVEIEGKSFEKKMGETILKNCLNKIW